LYFGPGYLPFIHFSACVVLLETFSGFCNGQYGKKITLISTGFTYDKKSLV